MRGHIHRGVGAMSVRYKSSESLIANI